MLLGWNRVFSLSKIQFTSPTLKKVIFYSLLTMPDNCFDIRWKDLSQADDNLDYAEVNQFYCFNFCITSTILFVCISLFQCTEYFEASC